MEHVCVAIATDDGERVKIGHFGDAKFYLHYVRGEDGWRLVRRVENPYAGHGHGHGHHGHHEHGGHRDEEKRRRILELNRGCTHIVATAMGPGGKEFMESHGVRVVLVKPRTSIEEALSIVEEITRPER